MAASRIHWDVVMNPRMPMNIAISAILPPIKVIAQPSYLDNAIPWVENTSERALYHENGLGKVE